MKTAITALIAVAAALSSGAAIAQQATTRTPPPAYAQASTPATTTPAMAPASTSPTDTSGSQGSLDLPAPDTTVSPINRPLMVTGIVLLGGTYAASAIDAAASDRDADKNNLYYPIVGPWMDYANRGGCPASGSCAAETGNKALLILDGIGQGLGAVGIVTSLFIPEKATRRWYLIGDSSFHAAPSPVGTGYGLGASGAF